MNGGSADCFLVVPCFQESGRLQSALEPLCETLSQSPFRVDVQIVDDGSGPDERIAVESLLDSTRELYPFVKEAIYCESNQGKGMAIRTGWNAAPQDVKTLAFIDADGATDPASFVRVLEAITRESRSRIGVGSRRVSGAKSSRFARRSLASWVFGLVVHFRYHLQVLDTQCGCKVIPAKFYRSIQGRLRQAGFGLDIELLRLAREQGEEIVEVPIQWEEQPGSSLRVTSVMQLFWDVLCKRI